MKNVVIEFDFGVGRILVFLRYEVGVRMKWRNRVDFF